jgi:hypothetical protein
MSLYAEQAVWLYHNYWHAILSGEKAQMTYSR